MTQILTETIKNGRSRWIRIRDLPCSRTFAYKLIKAGKLITVKFLPPGSRKGAVFIDANSLDSYLESLAVEQKVSAVAKGAA